MEDPDYDGNPAETLAQVNEMMEAHYFKNESCPYYWDLTEDPDAEGFSSITLHYLLVGKFNRLASSVFSDPMYRTEPLHPASWRMTRVSPRL